MDETNGARLKKVRLQKGITLEQVQKDTRIHARILKALEGEGVSDISPVYLRSFLKLYCKYLQVDPNDFVSDYRETQYSVDLERPVPAPKEKILKAAPRKAARKPVQVKIDIKQYIPKQALEKTGLLVKQAGSRFKSIKISPEVKMGVVTLCVLVLFVGGLVKLGQAVTRRVKTFVAHRRSAVTQTQTAAQSSPKKEHGIVEASVPTEKAQKDAPIRLVIRAQQNCWVYLKADGEVVFQRILEKGRFESWGAQDKMELSLGNAGGVEIEVNGQLFKSLGRDRQALKNIVITKEGMQVQ